MTALRLPLIAGLLALTVLCVAAAAAISLETPDSAVRLAFLRALAGIGIMRGSFVPIAGAFYEIDAVDVSFGRSGGGRDPVIVVHMRRRD